MKPVAVRHALTNHATKNVQADVCQLTQIGLTMSKTRVYWENKQKWISCV